MKKFLCMLIILAIVGGCVYLYTAGKLNFCEKTQSNPIAAEEESSPEPDADLQTDTALLTQGNRSESSYVDSLLAQMSLDEKIYQMMFVTPESITGVGQVIQAGDGTKTALENYPVGGIVYFAQNIKDREQVKTMLSNTKSYSKIPLFLGVDEEGGQVSRLKNAGIEIQPPMKEIGSTEDSQRAYQVGVQLANDLSELGFNVDFAPVADVLTNPNNSVIGSRSFGSDPELVSEMVAQEVRGLQENNISAALKHFPGHGDTQTDTHHGYSETLRTMDQLKECEFLPFISGIEADVDFVMVAHIAAVNVTEEDVPATLSKELITDCLLKELNFKGIVITDSFQMGAITQNYTTADAVVKSVDAGVDMILMPADVNAAYSAIKTAIEQGELSEERINDSVRKILSVKVKRKLF